MNLYAKHLVICAWIRIFVPDDPQVLPMAQIWAEIVTASFQNGTFDETIYADEYRKHIPILHKGERLIGLAQFYMVNLLQGMLDSVTEDRFVDHIIKFDKGIYYVYSDTVADLPPIFASKRTSGWIAALELLAGYPCAKGKLCFATQWLREHRDEDGQWDMGTSVKDGMHFPLADSWRKKEDRKRDCTLRIQRLFERLEV